MNSTEGHTGMNKSSHPSTNGSFFMPLFLLPPLPDDIIVSLIVCYTIIIWLSVMFNLVVIIVLAASKSKRTATDMFILSLAVSDLMVATLNMPFQLYYHVVNVWKIGVVLCKLSKYLQAVTIVSTVLTLTAIAIDRFVAICNPFGFRRFHSRVTAIVALVSVWVVSLGSVSPQLVVQKLDMRLILDPVNGEIVGFALICAEFFPHGERDGNIYSVVIFVTLYFIPVFIMFLCYGAIAHRLWIRQPVGDIFAVPQNHGRQMAQKKRIIKMLIAIVMAFTVLWFPFFTLSLYDDLQLNKSDISFRVTMAILQLIGYSNCSVNPIIYTFLNKRFQRDFRIMCCPAVRPVCRCCMGRTITIKQSLTPGVATTSVTINSLG